MIYGFEQYRLDTRRRELFRDGAPVSLRPKVFALLVLLIEERERVLDRETLFERLWPGRFVSDATLSSCIKELRKSLEDTGRERRFVRTVHGQGFRFVAPVTKEASRLGGAVAGSVGSTRDGADPGVAPSAFVPAGISTSSTLPGIPSGGASSFVPPALIDSPVTDIDFGSVRNSGTGEDGCRSTASNTDTARPERKRLSALHWTVIDADELAVRLDPEAMHALMQRLLAEVCETVERYDGQIAQWLSDGCLALFGVPRTHDDDARRAVLAAEEIHGRCRDICEAHELSVACGVTSGVVIVGGVPGQSGQLYSASGSLVRTARTLCFAAGGGEIAISDDTYRLVRGDVRVQPLRSAVACSEGAKAHDATVEAEASPWLVRRIVGVGAGVPRRFRRTLAPLIGRAREMDLLAHRLQEARAGAGQAVTLVGAAGIGKTRLLEEFRASLDEEGIGSVLVRCQPQRRHTTDHVLVGCLHALCGTSAADDDDVIGERALGAARAAAIDDAMVQSALLGLLGKNVDAAAPEPLSPRARREIAESALERLVFAGEGVRESVRVLIVEDLHWADASSAAWIGRLVQRMGIQRLLLLVSCRIGTQPDWLRCAGVTQMPLAPLKPLDARRLVEALPGPVRDDTATARIVASAGGNPFLLSELTLRRDDDQPIPDTVQALLAARIDELVSADKRVLQSASVLGLNTRPELLIGTCDAEEEDVRESLLRLQGLELLDVEFNAGEERVVFRHALVQEAAYAMLLADERVRLHGRVVALIDDAFLHEGAAHPEILAQHCERAGLDERAARLWQRAAWKASVRCAYVETAEYVERGLARLSAAYPSTKESLSGPTPSTSPDASAPSRPIERVELELALMRSLGRAQMATHGYASETVAATWSRAEALCTELADDVSLFQVLIGLGNYHLVSGEFEHVLPIVRRLARIARREEDMAMRAYARAATGELMMYLGRTRSAVRHLESCLALIGRVVQPSFLEDSATVLAQAQLAWTRWSLGEERSALAHGERALNTAHASGKPFLQAMALTMNAELHRFRDDAARAAVLAREAIDIAERQRFAHWHGFALVTLGWSEARRGDTATGLLTVEKGIALSERTNERLVMPVKLGVLADVQRLHGLPAEAEKTLERAFELAERTNGRYCLIGLTRVRHALGGVEPDAGAGHDGETDRRDRCGHEEGTSESPGGKDWARGGEPSGSSVLSAMNAP